jgi:glycosyltransferase involved in cell wall biosynthesis
MNEKPKVMLHYVHPGTNRSPNILFDRLEKLPLLQNKYKFVHLDQTLTAGGKINFKLIKMLAHEIKKKNPDIIHISGIVEGFHCMIAATLAGCKNRIIITHGFASQVKNQPFLKRMGFRFLIEPLTLLLATKIQCNSEFSLHQKVIMPFKRKAVLIYNLSPEVKVSEGQSYRERLKIRKDEFIFATASRITYTKGFFFLAQAIQQMAELNNIRFIIMGDGDYNEVFINMLKKEIESNKVIITGSIKNEEVLKIISESNVFVLPTFHYETFGLVFIEAALLKVPSIGTSINAVREVVIDRKTGLLVSPKNTEELVVAMKKLYNNPNLARGMGVNAFYRANQLFSRNIIAKEIDTLYRSMLK